MIRFEQTLLEEEKTPLFLPLFQTINSSKPRLLERQITLLAGTNTHLNSKNPNQSQSLQRVNSLTSWELNDYPISHFKPNESPARHSRFAKVLEIETQNRVVTNSNERRENG